MARPTVTATAAAVLEGHVDVIDVVEFGFEVVGAAAAVFEVDLLKSFGDDGAHLCVDGALAP
ncbi:hypothetical protein ACWGH3_39155 [Streptomyces sp. NPDC054884]|uniref:hypothetical protein n=1 Tax=Streptomyces sp. ME08-AFT2 TaxID=3028683 RepID=UPI0029A1BD1D|nr:hypothetical protein [Streptomyces sp. ME08-AFT2]MDX3314517.1 hypothetical protein [Streptomyces sp. ME08-AFT2]